jgi:hypothetical protein
MGVEQRTHPLREVGLRPFDLQPARHPDIIASPVDDRDIRSLGRARWTRHLSCDDRPAGLGLERTMVMRSQADPTLVYVLVLFESEDKARAREQDPRRQQGLERVRAAMGDVLDGPPEFVDLNVVRDE